MVEFSYIQKKCEQLQIDIPAIKQLEKALQAKDFETYDRIAENIIAFLIEKNIKLSQFPQF